MLLIWFYDASLKLPSALFFNDSDAFWLEDRIWFTSYGHIFHIISDEITVDDKKSNSIQQVR